MKVAFEEVFPNTFYHLCKWHITNKMGDKIGHVYNDKKAMDEFFSLVNHSESVEGFEER